MSAALVAFTVVPAVALLASAAYAAVAAYRLRDWRPMLFVVVVVLMAVHQVNELTVYLDAGAARASTGFGEYPETGVNLLTSAGAVAVLRSVSRQRELTERLADKLERERSLERENERLEEVTRIVSHDIKSPLNVACGRIELVREELDEENEHIAAAVRSLRRIEDIVEDTLTLAREGMSVEEWDRVSVADLARETWRGIDADAATLQVDDDPTIIADEDRLRHAFENLFCNAVEHGSTGNRTRSDDAVEHGDEDVTVTVGCEDDRLYVADDGPGIPAEEREAVLEPGHTTAEDGTGFGLAIVNRVARAHGWELSITESDAGGARFEFAGAVNPEPAGGNEPTPVASPAD